MLGQRSLGAVFALAGLLACAGPKQLYPGPARTADEVARVDAPRPARIDRVDDVEVDASSVALLPGPHAIEFLYRGGPRLTRTDWLLESRCVASFQAAAGAHYVFSAPISRESDVPGPSDAYRWKAYRAEPRLVASSGEAVAEMRCESTCRLHGTRPGSERFVDCEDSEAEGRAAGPGAESNLGAGSSAAFLDRAEAECRSRGEGRGIALAGCLGRLTSNPIVFRLPNGEVLHYVPAEETRMRPGLREEAREVCGELRGEGPITECLESFGWVRLP